jgi:hypothetical protein
MAKYTTKIYNGIEVIEDENRFFNMTKLVHYYQPKNKNISRYLSRKEFMKLFNITYNEYNSKARIHENVDTESDPKASIHKNVDANLSYTDAFDSSYIEKHLLNEYRGIYVKHEYLHIMLMILDPEYRAQANKVLDAVADVQRETHEDAHVTVTAK